MERDSRQPELTIEALAEELRLCCLAEGLGPWGSHHFRQLVNLGKLPTLLGLPIMQPAGGRATDRRVYLVERLCQLQPLVFRYDTDGNRVDNVLEQLFGLVERKSYRVRQSELSRQLAGTSQGFRRHEQQALFEEVAELLLNAVHPRALPSDNNGLDRVSEQAAIQGHLIEYIKRERPAHADLWELSTATIVPLLDALREAETAIRLLVGHPNQAGNRWAQDRLINAVRTTVDAFADYKPFEMRVYTVPPGVRGRLFDDYVMVGWYTHRDTENLRRTSSIGDEVWGHENIMIVGNRQTSAGADLANWFAREYESLWTHGKTCPYQDVAADFET